MIWTSRRLLDLAMSPIALYPYIRYRGYMDNESVIVALGALAQATRLDAFRLLVRHEPEGLPAGAVAKALAVPQNTLSVPLATLARAGLVTPERPTRIIQYRAQHGAIRSVLLFPRSVRA